MRSYPSLKAFSRRSSLAPTGAQKHCSKALRVILHWIACSRENATKLTDARSAEMVAWIESLLVMIRQGKSGSLGYCVRNRRMRAFPIGCETCANGQIAFFLTV